MCACLCGRHSVSMSKISLHAFDWLEAVGVIRLPSLFSSCREHPESGAFHRLHAQVPRLPQGQAQGEEGICLYIDCCFGR